MAKGKQYEDALGSIFDFIFTESKKPANKVKPVKVTGVDGTSELMNAVAAVLENPLLFVNDTTKDAFEGLINPDLASVDLGPNEKLKFSLKDVGSVLDGDTSFIDKQVKKLEANRKKGALEWAGEELSNIVATAWAKEHGLDITTRDALMNLSKSSDVGGLRDLNTAALSKALAEELLSKGVNFDNMQESAFKAAFGEKEGGLIFSSLQKIAKEYKEAQTNQRSTKEILDSIGSNHYVTLYPVFQSKYMEEKAEEEEQKGDEEKAKYYRQAQSAIDLYTQGSFRDRYLQRMKFKLKDEESKIRELVDSGRPVSKDRIRRMKKEVRRMKSELRLFRTQGIARELGRLEGHYNSVKGLYEQATGGQLLPAILKGDFFDPRKNKVWGLQPTQEIEFALGGFLVGGKVKIKVAKTLDSEGKPSKSLSQSYNQMMTDIYYLTPAALVTSLGTGEIFAYRAHRQMEKFLSQYKSMFPNLDLEKLFGPDGENYLVTFSNLDDFARLEEFFKSNRRLRRLAYNFGLFDRIKKNVSNFFKKGIEPWLQKFRGSVGSWLLKKIKGSGARKLIEQWMKSGAFKVLIEGIKMSIKTALGITTSGWGLLVSFVVDVLADLASRLGEKMVAPFLKFFFSAMIFMLVGVVGFVVMPFTFHYMNTRNMYAHVAPKDVIIGDVNLDIKFPPGGGEFEEYPPLSDGSNCPFGTGLIYCSQGPYVGTHSNNLLAIDLSPLASPDWNGYVFSPEFCKEKDAVCIYQSGEYLDCKNGGSGGGEVWLYTSYKGYTFNFRFVHVIPNNSIPDGARITTRRHIGQTMKNMYDGGYDNVTCWGTGEHVHLEVTSSADKHSRKDPWSVLVGAMGCSVSQCPEEGIYL